MAKILGLDLGTNSIGWALVDKTQNISKVVKIGSRIIPMTQDVLGKFDSGVSISQTAERTSFRGVRRIKERHLQRRERLHRVLNVLNFLPEHYSNEIDFEKRFGKFKDNKEPKLGYLPIENPNSPKLRKVDFEFIFKNSFNEMVEEFKKLQPSLFLNDKLIPYDWTIYYLRKKALTQKIEKEELAWLLLNFNQKRGYYQLRGEEEEENPNKLVEFYSLLVTSIEIDDSSAKKDEKWYSFHLENGWVYRRSSKTPLDWTGKVKDFIVTTDLNDDGSVKSDKDGKEKRSFRAPSEEDWTLIKKKTEKEIYSSGKTVGTYIFDTLLDKPNQKINGKLVRTIERKFYKLELEAILKEQIKHHKELQNKELYTACCEELYEQNDGHRNSIVDKGFLHLFLNDIIFYQRPLKSQKSQISDCKFEKRAFVKEGKLEFEPIKCAHKSHPFFQEFRLWQFIQNLRMYRKEDDVDVTTEFLNSIEDWEKLFDWLNKQKEIKQESFLKYSAFNIKKNELGKYRWNYVEDKIYPCNETRATIVSRLEKASINADFLTKEIEEALWHILYSVTDKIELEKALKTFAIKNQLNDEFVEIFKKYPPYKSEYGAYSVKALKKLLPLMRMGKYWSKDAIHPKVAERIEKIINGEYDETIRKRVREKAFNFTDISQFHNLPVWLTSYIVYNRHSEDGELLKWKTPQDIEQYLKFVFKQHSLRNPIVEQVIAETLRVVTDIWKYYGNSQVNFYDEIHIELGRAMKNNAKNREKITKQVSENENTNLRIKAMLMEFLNDADIENVRPHSPSQQEILKIYEEGVLGATNEIPDDILKISKQAQPTNSELTRYKLWLNQKYRSPYTGEVIPLNKLFTPAYEIEHIIPQSRYFDDSFSNKVICEAAVNQDKGNKLALEYIESQGGKIIETNAGKKVKVFTKEAYEEYVKTNFAKNRSKMKKLLMDDIPEAFVQRQLNDTRYISKVVKNLLSNIVREENEQETVSKHLLSTNGTITSVLKQDWGLNDIWNDIITPRFERLNTLNNSSNFGSLNPNTGKFLPQVPIELQKGFNKKRIDHRHHALDALVIACATRDHVNYLNNQSALSKEKMEVKENNRFDLRAKLCTKKYNEGSDKNYKWVFNNPWSGFAKDAKDQLESTVISFKQNLRVINKTINYYEKIVKDENGKSKKVEVKQTRGENWAIRKPMHKDTVSGLITIQRKKKVSLSKALEDWKNIVDKDLRSKVKELIELNYDSKSLLKFFKDLENKWNTKDISKLDIYYLDTTNVASRVKLDESFTKSKIENSIADTAIIKILERHLENFTGRLDEKGKEIAPETLAFSPDGIEELNKNIKALNNGKDHKPIFKVRTYEPQGNKFAVGQNGNKNSKFVVAATGTNLFFLVYENDSKNRVFETVQLNEVIEHQKWRSTFPKEEQKKIPSVPVKTEFGKLLFYLNPNDLIYLPTADEIENGNKTLDVTRIYKFTDSSDTTANFIPHSSSDLIFKLSKKEQEKLGLSFSIQNEFGLGSPQSKNQKSIDGIMIKEYCIKLKVDRLGNIKPA